MIFKLLTLVLITVHNIECHVSYSTISYWNTSYNSALQITQKLNLKYSHWQITLHFCFRFRIPCCIFKHGRFKVECHEWCRKPPQSSHFLIPVKTGEGWARSLYQFLKLYKRPNLQNTYDGHQLLAAERSVLIIRCSAIAERPRCRVPYSFGQKWKTGTGRQYFTDIIGLSSTTVI